MKTSRLNWIGIVIIAVFALNALSADAQIYNWKTGDVISGTENITPGPGVYLSHWHEETHNLRYADFSGGLDLQGGKFFTSWLDNARFTGANLSDTYWYQASLTNADFSGACVSRAQFGSAGYKNAETGNGNGLSATQLYSTASYQSGDLSGIGLDNNNITGWDFSNQNLTNANFSYATLTNTNLSGANVTDANFSGTTSRGFTKEQLYSTASYQDGNLRGIMLKYNDLTDWTLANRDLTNASFEYSTLTDTNFSGATVRGARLHEATSRGFTKAQLYSTASYKTGNLQGINLKNNDLTSWNLANQDLTNATFYSSNLTGINLNNATVNGTSFSYTTSSGFTKEQLYSTASYKTKNLQEIHLSQNNLSGWNLANQDLTGAFFNDSNLTNCNLNGATVAGTQFTDAVGFTKEKLYSTASFQNGNLQRIGLGENDLTGWNLSNQNLAGASFWRSTLTNMNLSGSIITGANFSSTTYKGFTKEQLYSTASYQNGALGSVDFSANHISGWNLSDQNLMRCKLYNATTIYTDFSRSDIRGARFFDGDGLHITAITDNLICHDGFIHGLNLGHDETLRVWDHNDITSYGYFYPAIAITVEDEFTLASSSKLEFLFEDDDWGSTITLEPGIAAALDGTISLGFAPDTDVDALLGTTFDLFNWNDALPTGSAFANVLWPDWAEWDITDLYEGGTVTLVAVPEPSAFVILAIGGIGLVRRR